MRVLAFVSILTVTALSAGCASTMKSKETDVLQKRVDSLEMQVSQLNQRVDQAGLPPAIAVEEQRSMPAGAGVSSSPARSKGTAQKKGLSVRQVQQALAAAGFYKGEVDGKSGPQTRKAVLAFQQAKGLKADGIVGSETSEALSRYLPE